MTENPEGLTYTLDHIRRFREFMWTTHHKPRARVWLGSSGRWWFEVWRTKDGSPKRVAVGTRPMWRMAYEEALFSVREIVHHEEYERTRPKRPRFIE